MDALTFLAAPSAMCFVLVGIHCYLGLHVLARGVIFVDLSEQNDSKIIDFSNQLFNEIASKF